MMERRGISQIIASMLMLAMVVGIGGTIMFSGISDIAQFNNMLGLFDSDRSDAFLEDLIIEHVWFFPSSNNATITIRNTGNAEITIDSIAIVHTETQELVLNNNSISQKIMIGDVSDIEQLFSLTQGTGRFDDNSYKSGEYRISVTTTRGNSFEMVAKPFNT
ncbi:hypothetical protein [Nitrosopumilus sp. b2]|uniref:hypothetical protein n=1 Tax=Nitrosopumilus sp. b2 TaxID=2109908 RepID=UPI0015F64007|nr:hypothetical protein [Nitrosopumilus sp. b2]KAF6244994.1 hypothetical protein C6989_05460 [Nitrosopumilus sp. b2]